jgi:hypothetical protein
MFCFLFAFDLGCCSHGSQMQIRTWYDHRTPAKPRVTIQQGSCQIGQCGQFSISICDGKRGMTVRFDCEAEFRQFLESGTVEQS